MILAAFEGRRTRADASGVLHRARGAMPGLPRRYESVADRRPWRAASARTTAMVARSGKAQADAPRTGRTRARHPTRRRVVSAAPAPAPARRTRTRRRAPRARASDCRPGRRERRDEQEDGRRATTGQWEAWIAATIGVREGPLSQPIVVRLASRRQGGGGAAVGARRGTKSGMRRIALQARGRAHSGPDASAHPGHGGP